MVKSFSENRSFSLREYEIQTRRYLVVWARRMRLSLVTHTSHGVASSVEEMVV